MSASKKRKISGLNGFKLELALIQLRKLRSSAVIIEVPESDPAPADTFMDQLDSMITTLETRLDDPLVNPFVGYLFCKVSPLLVTVDLCSQ